MDAAGHPTGRSRNSVPYLGGALESSYLPGTFHRDPADQIIVATARVHNLILLTSDRKILDYPHVKTHWE
jgi:PIN domain nuclease of toxin-antitoxin system